MNRLLQIEENDNYKYLEQVQTSVTIFLHHGDDFLFLKRAAHKHTDPNIVNGIGGRLEKGEDYLTAAIRETEEETAYKVSKEAARLLGVVKSYGSYYSNIWVICFFGIEVDYKKVLFKPSTADGEFMWINKNDILSGRVKLNFHKQLTLCMEEILNPKGVFFLTFNMAKDGTILEYSKS